MSTFITLRLILQEPKPDLAKFLVELEKQEIAKGDLDLLLKKAVESRPPHFSEFCSALVRYSIFHAAKELTSTSATRKVGLRRPRTRE